MNKGLIAPKDLALLGMKLDGTPLTHAVCRVFECSPSNLEWKYTGNMGVLFLSEKENPKSLFFKLLDVNSGKELWNHELYEHFELVGLNDYFFSFEGDESIFGLNFAEGQSSHEFLDTVKHAIFNVEDKGAQRIHVEDRAVQPKPHVTPSPPTKHKEEHAPSSTKKSGISGFFSNFSNLLKGKKSEPEPEPDFTFSVKKGTFKRGAHIGVDRETGQMTFENLPEEWQSMLNGFGVKIDLSQKDQQEAFVDTILAFEEQQRQVTPGFQPEVKSSIEPVKSKPPPHPSLTSFPVTSGGAPPPPPPPPPNFSPAKKAPKSRIPSSTPEKDKVIPPMAKSSSSRDDLLAAIRNANPHELLKRADPSKMTVEQKNNFESLLMQRMTSIRQDVEPESSDEEEQGWDD